MALEGRFMRRSQFFPSRREHMNGVNLDEKVMALRNIEHKFCVNKFTFLLKRTKNVFSSLRTKLFVSIFCLGMISFVSQSVEIREYSTTT